MAHLDLIPFIRITGITNSGPDKRAVCSHELQNRLWNAPSDFCCARSFLGSQEPPSLLPDFARQITIAASEQPAVRSGGHILLSRGSGGGRGCDRLLRGARDDPADDHFSGWNPCRRGTTALSTKIHSLG